MTGHQRSNPRGSDEYRIYIVFSVAEIFAVLIPVVVSIVTRVVHVSEDAHWLSHRDLLYAAVTLPGLAVCKHSVAYFLARGPVVRKVVLLRRILASLFLLLVSSVLLGLTYSEDHAGASVWVLGSLLLIAGTANFLIASSDYHSLLHPHRR